MIAWLGSGLIANRAAGQAAPAPALIQSDWVQTDVVQADLVKVDNGQICIGLKRDSGGAIAWVSAGGTSKNLVNAFDRGRLIQQSYYGAEDGSFWDKQPWRWNPVQGGDWRGASSRLLELKVEGTSVYVKTIPKHWANGQDIETAVMEQWLELHGAVAHVRYRFAQRGGRDHPERHQELPAVFVAPRLKTLALYTGDAPWTGGPLSRSVPGWPNESRRMDEHWAAYVDDRDHGLGVYVPVAEELTCYRYGRDESANDACSYFAPLGKFAVTANFQWQYDVYITIGHVDDIRSRFAELAKSDSGRAANRPSQPAEPGP